MPTSVVIAWSVAFSATAIAIIVGNSLTIAAFLKSAKLVRMRACYFLVSLAIADMMIGIITVPMYIILLNYHLQNREYQSIYTAVDIASGFASVFTLTAISLERLYAFWFPFKYRVAQTMRVYMGLVLIIWIMSAVITCLHMLFRYEIISYTHFFFIMFCSLTTCLLVMCTSYIGMWFKVHYHYRQNNRTPANEKKFARMIFTITALFIFTWLPFHLLNIINFFCGLCLKNHLPHNLLFFCKLLQYMNSFVNPIIYAFQMPEFRNTLMKLLCKPSPAREESRRIEEIPLEKLDDCQDVKM
ncbi:dopamine receptor 2-like [Actinia tenebrosa]|uniref:Dopamine receptor 2-like n=1 Tax=Actinia tenebrosa TaxID=6105 RepID=A0A6P8ICH7_ACTTE|nr:dopamine receptor 2-like [Actinia tenebrosa]XP_031562696.1 dopamine receptor 2-like [Actinia tenebrosa]XP_031562697.1 dopamine receptor 2-like [Actinia tenebrosa]XP_031562698.1 dopamine receptor 2-like [Actinia tenebrosa]